METTNPESFRHLRARGVVPDSVALGTMAPARAVLALAGTLNRYFDNRHRPKWMHEPTDVNLRLAGAYHPEAGLGCWREMDYGNVAGSIMMLALLLLSQYGLESAQGVNIFGLPPPPGLTNISTVPPQSGKGLDNRRCNALEGLLNLWQDDIHAQTVRG